MPETFDVAPPDKSWGYPTAGDVISQGSVSKFLPAMYLVFGAQDGPFTRVDTGAGLPVTIQNASLTVTGSLAGDVAHDAVDSGNPVKVGGQARTTNPTAVADGDRVNFTADKLGRQVVALGHARELVTDSGAVTISASTAETDLLAAGGAGVFHDLTMVLVSNTSDTPARVDFRDDAGGTVRFSLYCPAGAVVGFVPPRPFKQTAANKKWTAQSSANVTDLRITIQAEKNL